jgi:hypothetical protein
MKAIAFIVAFLLFFKLGIFSVFAVSVSISNFPETITTDPVTFNASILGASSGTNYLRVDFYKEGTSNYFGETFNGGDWYSGSDGKQYFPITIIDSKSTASASIKARIGAPNNTEYTGQGTYKMRIRRYTASGSLGSEDPILSAVNIVINIPTNTPTQTPTPTPMPTLTNTPTVTLKPSFTPTITKSISKTPTPTEELKESKIAVLGETTDVSNSYPKKDENKVRSNINILPVIFILIGIVFLILCVILVCYPYISRYLKPKNE